MTIAKDRNCVISNSVKQSISYKKIAKGLFVSAKGRFDDEKT